MSSDFNWPFSIAITWRLFIGAVILGLIAEVCIWTPEHTVELTFCDAECLLAYSDAPKNLNHLEALP